MVATTSWIPDLDSSSSDFVAMARRVSAGMTLAWSTTRPVSGGNVSASALTASSRLSRMANAGVVMPALRNPLPSVDIVAARAWLELHLRRCLRALCGGELDHRLVPPEECRGPNHPRKRAQLGIINPDGFDVVAPRD